MLSLLEDRKFVDEAVGKTQIKYVFYEMIPDHVKRFIEAYEEKEKIKREKKSTKKK